MLLLKGGNLTSHTILVQAETHLTESKTLLANSKATSCRKEQTLGSSLNELDLLKYTLVASTKEVAGCHAANAAIR